MHRKWVEIQSMKEIAGIFSFRSTRGVSRQCWAGGLTEAVLFGECWPDVVTCPEGREERDGGGGHRRRPSHRTAGAEGALHHSHRLPGVLFLQLLLPAR